MKDIRLIISFKKVHVNFNQRELRRLWDDDQLLRLKQSQKIERKLREIEKNLNRLEHVKSVVEHILLRSPK